MQHTINDIPIPGFDLSGKVAVVTGGTKGLGYGMALTLAHYGADVVVTSRTKADCDKVQKELEELGYRALGIPTDVSSAEQVDTMVEMVVKEFGKIDIMVCNAGIANSVPALKMSQQEWDTVIDIDLSGVFYTARAAARVMVEKEIPGRIIPISSAAAFSGQKNTANYCAAKAGVMGLVRGLAVEWGRYNITVNAVCPGYVPTSMNEAALSLPHFKQKIEGQSVFGRLGRIDEVALAVLMLASPSAGFITGTSILVDGGATIL